jgi:lysophospholipase L1-like esterase
MSARDATGTDQRVNKESCMRTLNTTLSFVCICLAAYGCASPTASEGEPAAKVASESQALDKGKLLALGDSIAFGYNPFGDFSKVKNFEGYPEMLGSDFAVKNASCPGETSKSIMDATAPDNGCRSYRAQYPLHVNYANSPTQLDYVLNRLATEPADDAPTLITLNVAGNDIFLLQGSCGNDPTCFGNGAGALIQSIATNEATILARIRGAGYQGRLVVMNLYSVDYSAANAATLGFLGALNGATAQAAHAFGAQVADAFGAFQTASAGSSGSACSAGLLIPNPAGGCDVHPSAEGQDILAQSVRDAH